MSLSFLSQHSHLMSLMELITWDFDGSQWDGMRSCWVVVLCEYPLVDYSDYSTTIWKTKFDRIVVSRSPNMLQLFTAVQPLHSYVLKATDMDFFWADGDGACAKRWLQ